MSKQVNSDLMVKKTLHWILNMLIWIFIIPAIIDIFLVVTERRLLLDGLFGTTRSGKDHTYFLYYIVYSLTWALFGIGLILGMIYIVVKGESIVEKLSGQKQSFK